MIARDGDLEQWIRSVVTGKMPLPRDSRSECKRQLYKVIHGAFYMPYTVMPAIADRMIRKIGESFFFAKCLYPNMDAVRIAVMITARRLI